MNRRIYLLPGYACTPLIWQSMLEGMQAFGSVVPLSWPVERCRQMSSLADLADWLYGMLDLREGDVIVGHSLGGLVALEGAARRRLPPVRIVLFESFLRVPPPFFRNLMMPGTEPARLQTVTDMMDEQRAHFSPALQEELGRIDLFDAAAGLSLAAVYGDRGCGQPERVTAELNWTAALRGQIPVSVVANTCHFPSLENPGGALNALGCLL